MIDKNKLYTLEELLEKYSMYNLCFKYFGNKERGDLELYLKTDSDKLSVFKSYSKQTKMDYLSLNENELKKVKFIFDREVEELEIDIQVYVVRTSNVNIPSARYTLKTLDTLTKEQDLKESSSDSKLKNGIVYMIVDNNTACNLYDDCYLFDKKNNGLIEDLKIKYETENNSLLKQNLKMILDYYDSLEGEKSYS